MGLRRKYRVFGILACLLLGREAFGVKEYYSIARHPRALGMGNAFYALSNDEYALYYNPAGLSRYAFGTQFMVQTRLDFASALTSALDVVKNSGGKQVGDILDSLTAVQGSPLYGNVGVSFPVFATKHFAFALQLADAKVDLAFLGKDINSLVDLTLLSDSGLLIGYGNTFFTPGLHLGVNAKGLVRAGGKQSFTILDIAQGAKVELDPQKIGGVGAGVDFDLGAIYELPKSLPGGKYTASLVFSNLLGSQMNMVKISGDKPPGLPRMLTLGAHAEFPGFGILDKFDVVLDFAEFGIGGESDSGYGARIGSFWKHVNLGLEVPINRTIFIRTGLRQGYITAGLGLDARFVKIDLATYAEELAELPGRLPSRRFALRLAFGYGGRLPTVASATSSRRSKEEAEDSVEEDKAPAPSDRAPVPDSLQLDAPNPDGSPSAAPQPDVPKVEGLQSLPAAPPAQLTPQAPTSRAPIQRSGPARARASTNAPTKRAPASRPARERFGLD